MRSLTPSRVAAPALAVLALAAGGVLAATGTSGAAPAAPAATPCGQTLSVHLSGTDTTVSSHELRPGVVRVDQANDGPGQHDLGLVRLHDGVTPEKLFETFTSNYAAAYGLVDGYGELNDTAAGSSASYTVTLDPGRYLVLDTGSTPDVDANFLAGLWTVLDVRGPAEACGRPPASGVRVVAHDDRYDMPAVLPRHATVELVDRGRATHDWEVARLNPGATTEQFLAAMSSGKEPPATVVHGFGPVSHGVSVWFDVDYTAGTYVAYDAIPDPATGMPGAARGLVATFTVR